MLNVCDKTSSDSSVRLLPPLSTHTSGVENTASRKRRESKDAESLHGLFTHIIMKGPLDRAPRGLFQTDVTDDDRLEAVFRMEECRGDNWKCQVYLPNGQAVKTALRQPFKGAVRFL